MYTSATPSVWLSPTVTLTCGLSGGPDGSVVAGALATCELAAAPAGDGLATTPGEADGLATTPGEADGLAAAATAGAADCAAAGLGAVVAAAAGALVGLAGAAVVQLARRTQTTSSVLAFRSRFIFASFSRWPNVTHAERSRSCQVP